MFGIDDILRAIHIHLRAGYHEVQVTRFETMMVAGQCIYNYEKTTPPPTDYLRVMDRHLRGEPPISRSLPPQKPLSALCAAVVEAFK